MPPTMRRSSGMSVEELLALPVMLPLWPDVGKALSMGRSQVYNLAAKGELPFPVAKIGNSWRVTRADLLRTLGMDPQV